MGFFGNLAKLTAQGYEMQQKMDVGATMAQAQQAMAQAGQYMAAAMPARVQTSAADEARRVHTTATVTAADQAPMMIGLNAVVELQLIVNLPGGVPLPVRRTEQLAPLHLARVAPGAALPVSIVPGMAETLRIEWAA